MSVIYIGLPVALALALVAVIAFVAQVRSGQFEDLETPPRRILFDDVEINDVEINDVEINDVEISDAGVNGVEINNPDSEESDIS